MRIQPLCVYTHNGRAGYFREGTKGGGWGGGRKQGKHTHTNEEEQRTVDPF